MCTRMYGWGWIMYNDFGGVALGHDGSNTLWYCGCQVLPHKDVAFLAVSNIGADHTERAMSRARRLFRNSGSGIFNHGT